MITALRSAAMLGTLCFGALLAVLLSNPRAVELSAIGFVEAQIRAEAAERVAPLAESPIGVAVDGLRARMSADRAGVDLLAASPVPDLVSRIVAGLCSCPEEAERRAPGIARSLREALGARAERIDAASASLRDFVEGRYKAIVGGLRRDVTIFVGTNAAAFALILLATFTGGERRALTIVPGIMLLVSVAICSAFYVLNTNWFYAIFFQDFGGYAYTGWVAVVLGLTADIVLNRGRVVSSILSSVHIPLPC